MLRMARRSKKPPMSQVALAARLALMGFHIDRTAISKIENGQRKVTDEEMLLFAKALDVNLRQWLKRMSHELVQPFPAIAQRNATASNLCVAEPEPEPAKSLQDPEPPR